MAKYDFKSFPFVVGFGLQPNTWFLGHPRPYSKQHLDWVKFMRCRQIQHNVKCIEYLCKLGK